MRKGISFLENGIVIILSPRIESPPSKFNGFAQGLGDMDYFNGHQRIPHIHVLRIYRLIQLGHVWAEIKEGVRMTLHSVKKRCYSTMDDFIFSFSDSSLRKRMFLREGECYGSFHIKLVILILCIDLYYLCIS